MLAWLEPCVSFVCFCRTRVLVGSRPHSPLDTVNSGIVFQSTSAPDSWVGCHNCFGNMLLSMVRDTVPFSHHHALAHSCCHHVGVGKVTDRHRLRCAKATQHSAAQLPRSPEHPA